MNANHLGGAPYGVAKMGDGPGDRGTVDNVHGALEPSAQDSTAPASWFLVIATGRVQGAFGSALFADACACADRVVADTGVPARVIEYRGPGRSAVGALYAQPTVKAALYCGKVPSPGLVP